MSEIHTEYRKMVASGLASGHCPGCRKALPKVRATIYGVVLTPYAARWGVCSDACKRACRQLYYRSID